MWFFLVSGKDQPENNFCATASGRVQNSFIVIRGSEIAFTKSWWYHAEVEWLLG